MSKGGWGVSGPFQSCVHRQTEPATDVVSEADATAGVLALDDHRIATNRLWKGPRGVFSFGFSVFSGCGMGCVVRIRIYGMGGFSGCVGVWLGGGCLKCDFWDCGMDWIVGSCQNQDLRDGGIFRMCWCVDGWGCWGRLGKGILDSSLLLE